MVHLIELLPAKLEFESDLWTVDNRCGVNMDK